jgi:Uma2 family endonuclease
LQPDVSVIWPDQVLHRRYQRAPMLAIEVISPANTDNEIDRKVQAYLEGGAGEVWIVRPKTSSMTVFRQGEAAAVRYTDAYRYAPESLNLNVREMIHGQ